METLNNHKTVDRKPQHLLKKEQQQSLPQGDVYHPDGKKGFGENDQRDQKEISKRNQLENRSNGFKHQDNSEMQIVRLETDGLGTDSKKSLVLQEKVGEVDRTVQVISSDYSESVNRDSVNDTRKSKKLVQGNQVMNHSEDASFNSIESRETSKGADRLRKDERA
ncbi:hypothetical protein [Bacillus subtilis]|uniref:Uncharacterized protein n=1 Tax=Bacillus subtilis subsp. subtilis TaxID=135461 RepID=A0ABD3ZTM2_BACIU|nr:hypothetical protein [Bacillus subtilis]KIL31512.1 hypothetical protein B4067_4739 [Bacillus subtilis subsp. subtilis]KIN47917.1 hypothetical protein B4145_4699 [Bacillus subtilis]